MDPPLLCQLMLSRGGPPFALIHTLVYRIDMQDEINVQAGKFLKNIKHAGLNRNAWGKFFRKSINVQGEKILENKVKV